MCTVKMINNRRELNEVLDGSEKFIIKVGTTHCGMCKVMEGNITKVLSKDDTYASWCFYVIDGETCEESILDTLRVSNIPTTYIGIGTRAGKGIMNNIYGVHSESSIREVLDRIDQSLINR